MANIRLQMYILHWMSVINDFPLYFRTKFPFQHLKNGQLHTHSDGVGAQWVKIGLWSCGIQFLKFGVCPAQPRKKKLNTWKQTTIGLLSKGQGMERNDSNEFWGLSTLRKIVFMYGMTNWDTFDCCFLILRTRTGYKRFYRIMGFVTSRKTFSSIYSMITWSLGHLVATRSWPFILETRIGKKRFQWILGFIHP